MNAPLRMDPTRYAALLDEVAAMVAAQRPLVPGLRMLEDQHLGRIGRAASSLRQQLQQGRSVADALQTLDPRLGPQLAAAFHAAADGGGAAPLHRLAELLRRRRELATAARLALLYPIMLLVLGYAVLVRVFAPLVTQDQTAIAIWSPAVVAAGRWLLAFWYLPPLLAGLAGGALWLAMRLRPQASWHPVMPGRYGRLALFCETLAMQIDAGVPQQEAVRVAAQISGDRRLQATAAAQAASLQRGEAAGSEADGAVGGARARGPLPAMLAWLLRQAAVLGGPSTAVQLRSLGRWYEQRERNQRRLWVRWLPALLVSGIGGTFLMVYLFLALRPIYNQLAGVE